MVQARVNDDEGFDVNDEVEVTDLDDQVSSSDAIDNVKGVQMRIRRASINTTEFEEEPACKSLHVECEITEAGVDNEGRYAGKVFFPEFILWFDLDRLKSLHAEAIASGKKKKDKAFNERWWTREAKYPIKQFGLACGIIEMQEGGKLSPFPRVNDDFLESLKGVEFVSDIKKVKDTYRGDGFFKNELANYARVNGDGDDDQ
jgi:hypothetical protein